MREQEPQRISVEEAAARDFEFKKGQSEKWAKYYRQKAADLDLKSMERFKDYHPNPSKLMRQGITFAHRDLESVAEAMSKNQPWAVVSGLNPSGPLHFGHKQVFDDLLWFQEQGAEVYIPITNDESYLVGKAETLAQSRRIAHEVVIPSIVAMGFNSQKTHIFVDSDYKDIYNVAIDISKDLSLNRVFGVFVLAKSGFR